MPIPIAVPQFAIIGVYIEGRLNDQQVITGLHYKLATTGGLPDAQAEALAVINAIKAPNYVFERYRGCVTTEVLDLKVYAQWLYPQRLRYVTDGAAGVTGLVAGPTCPPNVAQVITRGSDIAGRKGIGNLHLPGVPFDAVINGRLTDGQQLVLQELADLFVPNFATPNGEYYNVLYRRSNPLLGEVIDAAFSQQTTRVMRRRTVGLGS